MLDQDRLRQLLDVTGPAQLVLDLSCRRKGEDYFVVTDRWQRFTEEKITPDFLQALASSCAELLVHGVDVEGRMQGIEAPLIRLLGEHSPLPVTYAGGIRSLEDMEQVRELGQDRVDATIGSALDIFGGSVAYQDVLSWCKQQ
jgi:phosphoribosylformimino-5-aminoimidazole carboxamide ribotide isomerase